MNSVEESAKRTGNSSPARDSTTDKDLKRILRLTRSIRSHIQIQYQFDATATAFAVLLSARSVL
jgi:hypothetical protein